MYTLFPGTVAGMVSPYVLGASSLNHSKKFAAYVTSPFASAIGFPFSCIAVSDVTAVLPPFVPYPCDQLGEIIRIVHHKLIPLPQHLRPLATCRLAEAGKRRRRCLDSLFCVFLVHLGHRANDLAAGRVVNLECLARLGVNPFAIDIRLALEQRWIAEGWDVVLHAGVGSQYSQVVAGVDVIADGGFGVDGAKESFHLGIEREGESCVMMLGATILLTSSLRLLQNIWHCGVDADGVPSSYGLSVGKPELVGITPKTLLLGSHDITFTP